MDQNNLSNILEQYISRSDELLEAIKDNIPKEIV